MMDRILLNGKLLTSFFFTITALIYHRREICAKPEGLWEVVET